MQIILRGVSRCLDAPMDASPWVWLTCPRLSLGSEPHSIGAHRCAGLTRSLAGSALSHPVPCRLSPGTRQMRITRDLIAHIERYKLLERSCVRHAGRAFDGERFPSLEGKACRITEALLAVKRQAVLKSSRHGRLLGCPPSLSPRCSQDRR